jgi:hypothetical protein
MVRNPEHNRKGKLEVGTAELEGNRPHVAFFSRSHQCGGGLPRAQEKHDAQ